AEADCDGDGIPNYLDEAQYSCGDLPTTTVLTPNGDRMNDQLMILGLEEYDQNEIIIYNRWGNKVWEIKGYENDENSNRNFRGESNIQSNSKGLPDGTYFFVFRLVKDGREKVERGSIEIRR
ncbi:MAG: gliding motility-associated C-terminal domain-containing protein, partial [Cyclobacteriaceae bacterium]|nr:gliding motility-associated C-terminal domain-containing protein [Cyclobacteriaceae bacterium HetDA_MAG_MS6]